jgi:DnaK suppressor protein
MSPTTASVIVHTGDDFLVRQRGELNARRTSYRVQVDRLSSAIDELAEAGATPDLGDDEEFAEADSVHVERDRVLALRAQTRLRLDEIEAALLRLESGAYGACRTCRRPIPVARLEAVPEATQCVGCASGSVLRRR